MVPIKLTDCLTTWAELNRVLTSLTEEECLKLLDAERAGEDRKNVLLRIHSRYNKLRAAREREEILKGKGI